MGSAGGSATPEGVVAEMQALHQALERLQEHFHIQAIVGADPDEAANFDKWGRPLPDKWVDRRSDWKDYAQSVHVVGDG